MGWCRNCGTKTKGKTHLCTTCRSRDKNGYKPPKVPLTESDKANIELLRRSYDTKYAVETYFKEAYNSL